MAVGWEGLAGRWVEDGGREVGWGGWSGWVWGGQARRQGSGVGREEQERGVQSIGEVGADRNEIRHNVNGATHTQ